MGKVQRPRQDLHRTNCLRTPQRTRSLSSEHLYSKGTVHTAVREPVFQRCGVNVPTEKRCVQNFNSSPVQFGSCDANGAWIFGGRLAPRVVCDLRTSRCSVTRCVLLMSSEGLASVALNVATQHSSRATIALVPHENFIFEHERTQLWIQTTSLYAVGAYMANEYRGLLTCTCFYRKSLCTRLRRMLMADKRELHFQKPRKAGK